MAGQIVRRGKRTWLIRVFVARDASGRRKLVSKVVHGGRRDAEKALHGLLAAKAEQRLAMPERMTVAAYLERWLQEHADAVAASTLDGYRMIVKKHLIPGLGHVRLDRLTPAHVRAYLTQKARPGGAGKVLSATTRRKHMAVLHKALNVALRLGILAANPCDRVDAPRPTRYEARVLDEEQVRLFLAEAKRASPYHALYLTAIVTGLRAGELLGLAWRDVDLALGTLSVRQTFYRLGARQLFKEPKSAAGRRTIPLPPVLVEELRRVRERQAEHRRFFGAAYQDQELVFCQPNGKPLHLHNIVQRDFRRVLSLRTLRDELKAQGVSEEALPKGLPRVRFHDLRHGVGTHLGKLGVPVKVIQEYLGHSTPAFTLSVYSHVLPGMKEDAAARLAERLLGHDNETQISPSGGSAQIVTP